MEEELKVIITLFRALFPILSFPQNNLAIRFNCLNLVETILRTPAIKVTGYLFHVLENKKCHWLTKEKSGYTSTHHNSFLQETSNISTHPEIVRFKTGLGSSCRAHAPPNNRNKAWYLSTYSWSFDWIIITNYKINNY